MFKFDNAFHTKNKKVGMQFNDTNNRSRKVSIYPDNKGLLVVDCTEFPVSMQEGVEITSLYNKLVRYYQ